MSWKMTEDGMAPHGDAVALIEVTGEFRWAYGLYLQRKAMLSVPRITEETWHKLEVNLGVFNDCEIPMAPRIDPMWEEKKIPVKLYDNLFTRMMSTPPPVLRVMIANHGMLQILIHEMNKTELECLQMWFYPSITDCPPYMEYHEKLRKYYEPRKP